MILSKIPDFCNFNQIRQHFPLSMIEYILKSTHIEGQPPKKLGVLYDIGCTLEKGIVKVYSCYILRFLNGSWWISILIDHIVFRGTCFVMNVKWVNWNLGPVHSMHMSTNGVVNFNIIPGWIQDGGCQMVKEWKEYGLICHLSLVHCVTPPSITAFLLWTSDHSITMT